MLTKGQKAHIDDRLIKVGRIKFNSWQNKILKATDIVVYESQLIHISNSHGVELSKLGMRPLDYVNFIIDNFSEVREGSNNSILFVVANSKTSHAAALQLVLCYELGKEVYKIKTASPMKTVTLLKKKLLCANDHQRIKRSN